MSVPEVHIPASKVSGLEALPNDVLLEIMGHLRDPVTAMHTSITCRYLHATAYYLHPYYLHP